MVDVGEIPVIQLGKNGVSDSFIAELKSQLKKNKVVKVKMLKSSRGEADGREIPKEVAAKLRAELVDVRGYTFILKRR